MIGVGLFMVWLGRDKDKEVRSDSYSDAERIQTFLFGIFFIIIGGYVIFSEIMGYLKEIFAVPYQPI
ncbi:hypothetical protein CMT56_11695 [Elizabethkingia anophelis]|nr:hypothetical protein BBD30_05970 [Elizabethkingia anophelis]MDV3907967.1 hypothetical protein [Elizabethkingia anophelis]MDV3988678.1 hypothetical protein [Elizabethkingia anophelis]OPB65800.1 hypothetical protein BAS07_04725 [Elizabethkingia anophelis]